MGRITNPLLACALLLAGGLSTAEAAKECKPLHKVSIRPFAFPTEALARNDAATTWSMQVAVKHTPKFANIDNANNRKYSCSKKTSPVGVNTYACGVEARPCAFN